MGARKPLTKRELTELKRRYPDHPGVLELIKELQRIHRRFVGEELMCMSSIAERCGRRVKILVNRLNEDAAHIACTQGVEELQAEVDKWNSVPVEKLNIPVAYKEYLELAGIGNVGSLLLQTDKDLQRIDIFGEEETFRIHLALVSLGCRR